MTFSKRALQFSFVALTLLSAHSTCYARKLHLIGCADDIKGINQADHTVDNNALGPVVPCPYGPVLANSMHADAEAIRSVFGVDAIGVFVSERQGENACAVQDIITPEELGGPVPPCQDGTVYFGVKLMAQQLQPDRGSGWGIPAIAAHEFAHILQFKKHFPAAHGIWCELHADYMAGWFMAWRTRQTPTQATPALDAFFKMGDGDFTNPDHHGSPQQRASAFNAGFQSFIYNPTANQAYEAGIRYLRTNEAAPL